MESHLFVSLKDVMEKWINDHCQDDVWPNAYIYKYQSKDMAKAAALVFDASVKGQEFLENENDLN